MLTSNNFFPYIIFLFAITLLNFISQACALDKDVWFRSHANYNSNKYSSLSQINRENIDKLELSWAFNKHINQNVQMNPIMAGNVLIVGSGNNKICGLDPLTGRLIWEKILPAPAGKRGVVFSGGVVYVPTGQGVYAIDSNNGKIKKDYGVNGIYGSGISYLPPIVTGNKIIVADFFPAIIHAYDLSSGKSLWNADLSNFENVKIRIWSGISFDEINNILYIPTSNSGYITEENIKSGGYSSSLIAIDSNNGEILWRFKDIYHDLWDLDVVGPPILHNLKVFGKNIPAIIAFGKSGNIIFLNRLSGNLIHNNELLREISPKSFFSGNPSQIKSLILKPLSSNNYFDAKKDITSLSKEQRDYVLHKIRNAKLEKFSVLSVKNSPVVMFGLNGGPEWPGGAINQSNILFYTSNHQPWILRAEYKIDNQKTISNVEVLAKKNIIYRSNCIGCHGASLNGENSQYEDTYHPSLIGITDLRTRSYLTSQEIYKSNHKYIKSDFSPSDKDLESLYSLLKSVDLISRDRIVNGYWQWLLDNHKLPGTNPPWGFINAIDLRDGSLLWKIPFGFAEDPISKKQYPGDMNYGGLLVTHSNLVVATGTRDNYFRVYDSENGKELYREKMQSAGSAPPMTYSYKGCQYFVFEASGGQFLGYKTSRSQILGYKLKTCINEK
jgi:quinoprotein glucose dehydrogenase